MKKKPFYRKPEWIIPIIISTLLAVLFGGKYYLDFSNKNGDSYDNQIMNTGDSNTNIIGIINIIESENKSKNYVQRGRCIIPNPLYGTITLNGLKFANVKMTITNRMTYESTEIVTNGDGTYLIEIGNFDNCWTGGDKVEFKICYDDKCTIKSEILPPLKGYYEYNFDLS